MRFVYWGIACALASSSIAVTNSVLGPSSNQATISAETPSPYDAGQPIGTGLVATPVLATDVEHVDATPSYATLTNPSMVRFDEVPLAEPINLPASKAMSYQDKLFESEGIRAEKVVAETVVPETQLNSSTTDLCNGCKTPEYFAQSKARADTVNAWSNPTTTAPVAVTQDAEQITIPQQGAVDLGNGVGAAVSEGIDSRLPSVEMSPVPQAEATLPSPGETMYQPAPTSGTYSSSPVPNYAPSHAGSGSMSYPSDYSSPTNYAAATTSSAAFQGCGCGDAYCHTGGCASATNCGLGNHSGCGSQSGGMLSNHGCSSCGQKSCLGGCGLIGKLSQYVKVNPDASCSGWFAGAYYLNLGRDDDTVGTALASSGGVDVLSTSSARMDRASGVGARVGKMINQNNAFEVIYWQVFPQDEVGFTAASITGSPIDANQSFGGLTYDDGSGAAPLDTFFQGAQSIAVKRKFDYRNFELNFLRLPFNLSGASGRATLALVAGFRYFEGAEGLELFADPFNETRGDDPASEVSYFVDVENQLAGIQVGGLGSYQLTDKLYGQFGTKVGLYNNHMTQHQSVSGGNGFGTLGGSKFDIASDKNDAAFLAEVDAGLAYSFTQNWRLNAGYKLVAVSSYADATSQLLRDFTVPAAKNIQDNNSLILHGFFFGAEYAF